MESNLVQITFIPTKNEHNDDVQRLFAHYGITVGFKIKDVLLSAELEGLVWIITEKEDIDSFYDRFFHSISSLGVQWTSSSIKPGIFYQIYLKEDFRNIDEFVDGVLGIKVDVDLN